MSPTLQLNGVSLHYDDGGRGPALVLSHGFSATGEMWRPQRVALESRCRVVTWDLRGHGRSDSPADPAAYSAALAVADLLALLDHLGLERAVIGGLSLGGFLSLAFYRQHPERVRALVVADSGPGYRDPAARARWNESAHGRARELEERGLEALGGASTERRQGMRQHRSAVGLAHAARGMLTQADAVVIDSLPAVAVPTLIVVGADDTPFVAASEYMARKIPGARLAVIPDAGHAANLDQPKHFNAALNDFLDELDGGA